MLEADRGTFIETIDVRERQTLRWGFLRAMFPSFAEEVELGRYVKQLVATRHYRGVRLDPHLDPATGKPSPHVFDIYAL